MGNSSSSASTAYYRDIGLQYTELVWVFTGLRKINPQRLHYFHHITISYKKGETINGFLLLWENKQRAGGVVSLLRILTPKN